MIEPLRAVLDRFAAREGWNSGEVADILLQFMANAEGGPAAAASDLDAFLTDLTAGEEGEVALTPRERCYAHLEALEGLLTAGPYEPGPAAWIVLEALLGRTLSEARRAQDPRPDPDPGFYATLSVPIAEAIGRLEDEDEARIAAAFAAGGVAEGVDTGSGHGFRDFAGATRTPEALLASLAPLLPPDTQLTLRRMGGAGDADA